MNNAKKVKENIHKLSEVVSFKYPAMGWYFSSKMIDDSFIFKKDKWVCMFMYIKMAIKKEKRICFSADCSRACPGPAEYFGFSPLTSDDGRFIAEKERFKKTRGLAREYYTESLQGIQPAKESYLYAEKIEAIGEDKEIEVINLFPDLTGLASLTVLSNYDREKNMDNVLAPFASGCQSFFAIPYNENSKKKPKSIIGLMDPLARHFIPDDMIAFSVPSNRFMEMTDNIKGSFLDKDFKNPNSF